MATVPTQPQFLPDGGVTSPRGWQAGARYVGIKRYGTEPRLDLGLLWSERLATAAGVFTRNKVCGAPVAVCRENLADGRAHALVANSGCSNVAMGARGLEDARRMAAITAARLHVSADQVLVASTGVIARPLPMPVIEQGIGEIELTDDGGASFARAIMTTDTVSKERAIRFSVGGQSYVVGGTAKGSGMVHPDMATVFCFLTTDAPIAPSWIAPLLKDTADRSINMTDVDMDTSTSDTMLLLANGAAGGELLSGGEPLGVAFQQALMDVAIELSRDLCRDGEGAETLIEVVVKGASSESDARRAARCIASSPLVKTMITGKDANLGRVLMALGRSGAQLDVESVGIWIGEHEAFHSGTPTELDLKTISDTMRQSEVRVTVELGLGGHQATAWGCDLTEGYIRINADYTT
ncbi:MAG: bifunctional glutamate N-acetyltransferase/amino-acid acetyltransferase ArgJ [Polyangiaceae bacterium]|nr:bifunctional glutamate N-acetyltransferase/amino-acid acetyltransferase ArgJ [Polyangiaceae bacterium]